MFYEKEEDYLSSINDVAHFDLKKLMQTSMTNYDSSRFFTPEEGLLRGNMFKEDYKSYKNLTFVPLNPKTEKELLFLKICAFDFAVIDLGLYLDIYPDDTEAFELFKRYAKEYRIVKEEYEKTYGPICLEDTFGNNFNWPQEPWPWEIDGGSMYV